MNLRKPLLAALLCASMAVPAIAQTHKDKSSTILPAVARDDGTAPTASVGIPTIATSSAPACFQYTGPLSGIQFIAISGSLATDINYYHAN